MTSKTSFIRKPWVVFTLLFLAINSIFWLFEIKEFDGTYLHLQNGVECQEPHTTQLSLSHFLGIGSPNPDVEITKMTLSKQSIALILSICLFMPLLIAYRVHLGNTRKLAQK